MKSALIHLYIGMALGQVAGAFIFDERAAYALWVMIVSGIFITATLLFALRMRP